MNSLIIIACFVVALLALVGLVFALREPATSTASAQKATPNTPPTPASAIDEAKTTTQLPDLSTVQAQTDASEQPPSLLMAPAQTDASEQPTSLLMAPAQTETAPLTFAPSEDAHQSDEHSDIDELDYADLSTIRSLPSHHYDSARAEEEQKRATYDQLQTIATELRALHSQMKNMEQRINIVTDQVQYLRGNDLSEVNWDLTSEGTLPRR